MDAPRVSLDCTTGHTSKKNIVTLNKGQILGAPSWYVNEIRPVHSQEESHIRLYFKRNKLKGHFRRRKNMAKSYLKTSGML